MPTNILNLPAFDVLEVAEDEHDYHIRVETKQSPKVCACCGSDNIIGSGRRENLVKDLPMHGKRVGIYVNLRRMKCHACGKTFSETLPDVDDKRGMTNRLLEWAGKQSVRRTFTSIADEVGISEASVRALFKDYVTKLESQIKFETPQWLGMDEIYLIKPRGVIANVQDNTMIDLLVNRNKETIIHYLSNLKGKEQVKYVTMDMWKPYREACQQVIPQAKIIIDKFHVVRMANNALESVRKSLRESLTAKERRTLMHDRFILLKRERDLNEEEILLLSGWTLNYPLLGEAYRLKESFYGIYDATIKAEAQQRYQSWLHSIPSDLLLDFADLTRACENWHPWIMNYFDHRITNAYTESLNNLIRATNRKGRGYSFEALRAKMLFSEGLFKKEKVKPKFNRRRQEEVGFYMSRTLMDCYAPPEPTTQIEKNLGVDINKLIELLEAEQI
ncbi:MAG: ISL3 family transposase [Polynucleobacter sp. 35-46-11]|uniref:ISL3 family transposase n=1 Tax=Polynucleobacter sp. 35-46-11 TaxID=1970425 RepID=UPI000BC3ABBD|nr:ISL3 family transposase [Polynucleobacter sp. 35-46-11]OYY09296.1 MAG: ISL3 family transposase [Polynucleobacter sp. 35-46-11]